MSASILPSLPHIFLVFLIGKTRRRCVLRAIVIDCNMRQNKHEVTTQASDINPTEADSVVQDEPASAEVERSLAYARLDGFALGAAVAFVFCGVLTAAGTLNDRNVVNPEITAKGLSLAVIFVVLGGLAYPVRLKSPKQPDS